MSNPASPNPDAFLLGVSLDAAEPASAPLPDARELLRDQLRAARLLDAASVDFLTLGDGFAGPLLDASLTASYLSPFTRQIGIVPTITTTHTEPFHVATATATLDYSARARAGWAAAPSLEEEAALAFGRRPAGASAAAWEETGAVIELVRALWESWEPGAEIRDARTGRFLDRSKVHYVDAELRDSVGAPYSVKGPSIVPAPPQINPPVFITAADADSRRTAVTHADVIVVPASEPEEALLAINSLREELEGRAAAILASLPYPEAGTRVADIAAPLRASGAAGLHLRPGAGPSAAPSIAAEVTGSRGALGAQRPGRDLRDRLGLPAARNRFAAA